MEIGVSTGWLFFKVNVSHKIGIDPHFNFNWYNQIRRFFKIQSSEYYEMTSDHFFAHHAMDLEKTGGIDIAFVDGLHTYQQAYRDVIHCLRYLNPGGIIFLHDCNPPNEACGWPAKDIIEFRQLAAKGEIAGYLNAWNGDVWKAIVRLRSAHPDLCVGTIDIDWGIGYVYKGYPKERLEISESDIENLNYRDLEKRRKELIGLSHPNKLNELLLKVKNSMKELS